METIKTITTEELKELILINNDRFEGYEKALELTTEADLHALFTKYSNESNTFSAELKALLPETETPVRGETKLSGKFYRAWMQIKSALDSTERKAVLSFCEKGEDVAKKAYEDALSKRASMPENVVKTIQKQFDKILDAHNTIKGLRDRA